MGDYHTVSLAFQDDEGETRLLKGVVQEREEKKLALNPWVLMSKPIDLKILGKFSEELNECGAASSRCIIQGIDESEPVSGKPNKQWLAEEIGDVYANISLVIEHFKLDPQFIADRVVKKLNYLIKWHKMEV